MATQAEMLTQLLDMTHAGPVFGPDVAFGKLDAERRAIIFQQAAVIAGETAAALTPVLIDALPEESSEAVGTHVRQIVPKATAFVPALTAGELAGSDNVARLSLATQAVSAMYAADQLVDRGDRPMGHAIKQATLTPPLIGPDEIKLAAARHGILRYMRDTISELAGDDADAVRYCFENLVLGNEVVLQQVSDRYRNVQKDARAVFLKYHARDIGRRMVADAGFQSVTSSLHTVYRANDPSLPSIDELHGDRRINELLQVCNAVARVADERGDWWMDAGNNPELGVFSINPFNLHDPTLIRELCTLAGIHDHDQIQYITAQFRAFSTTDNDTARLEAGEAVTSQFFTQMRDHIAAAEEDTPASYRQYLALCRRVGEICAVNMLGDIHMGSARPA